MKILFLSSYYPPNTKGGAEISTQLLAEALAKRGHNIHVITSGNNKDAMNIGKVKVLPLPIPLTAKPLFERRHSRKIAQALLKYVPDLASYAIIHAHDFRTALVLSELKSFHAAKFGQFLPAVATIRDYAPISGSTNFITAQGLIPASPNSDARFSHRITEASIARKIFRYWQYRYNLPYRGQAFSSLPWQIFISYAQRELIGRHLDIGQIKSAVIYNPLPASYLADPVQKGQSGLVTYIGTVESYKGVGLLLAAARVILSEFPRAHLNIIGEGADRKYYQYLVTRWGLGNQVTFTGRLAPDLLQKHYDQSEIVVAPSIWIEPFGRTVAEAMARGKVVVTANAGGPSELVKDGERGLLFNRNDVNSLREKLKLALTLNQKQKNITGLAARQWVTDNLNKDNIAKQHEEFYQQCLNLRL